MKSIKYSLCLGGTKTFTSVTSQYLFKPAWELLIKHGTRKRKPRIQSGRIFGDHPHLLISFLNAVLPLPEERLLFGTSQAFVKQLNSGEDYDLLQPVYGLGLVAQKKTD